MPQTKKKASPYEKTADVQEAEHSCPSSDIKVSPSERLYYEPRPSGENIKPPPQRRLLAAAA